MSLSTLSNILICIGLLWIVAGYFSYMQTIKINKVIHELGAKAEHLYSGKNAGFMRTRRISFVAASSSGKVVDARTIKAAVILKPAKVVPFDEIIGKNLNNLSPASLGLEPVMEQTAANLLKDFKKRTDPASRH